MSMNRISKWVCRSCGRAFYPRHARCSRCGATEFDTDAFEGTGKLITFTRVHALSLAYTDLYITLGIVEFPDGSRALGRLDVDEPEIGMLLRASVGVVRDDGLQQTEGLRFTPA
jgi:uncharacterized OB-fold protein